MYIWYAVGAGINPVPSDSGTRSGITEGSVLSEQSHFNWRQAENCGEWTVTYCRDWDLGYMYLEANRRDEICAPALHKTTRNRPAGRIRSVDASARSESNAVGAGGPRIAHGARGRKTRRNPVQKKKVYSPSKRLAEPLDDTRAHTKRSNEMPGGGARLWPGATAEAVTSRERLDFDGGERECVWGDENHTGWEGSDLQAAEEMEKGMEKEQDGQNSTHPWILQTRKISSNARRAQLGWK
ncbi:hypothetical protein C8J57DRAFT_1227837 [Mycena rebaudengoi]|nr:hypothetical protein C8J57DRAFT_1227837 [Mycena rebaudengoi]